MRFYTSESKKFMIRLLTGLFLMLFLCSPLYAQGLQGFLSLDARGGYSTNTMMVPFHGEWNQSVSTGYGLLSPSGTLVYDNGQFSTDLGAGGFFETFSEVDRHTVKGGYGLWNIRQGLGSGWTLGAETGANRVALGYDRSNWWAIPWMSWQPDLFTRFRIKAGSSFRRYRNVSPDDGVGEAGRTTRFDLYSVEAERWFGFRWQVRAGFFGDLSDPVGTAGLFGSVEHLITNRFRIGARAGLDQYSYQMNYVDGSGPGAVITVDETDRIWRSGIQARYQLMDSVALTASGDHLRLSSAASDQVLNDFHISAGVRFTIRPVFNRDRVAETDWQESQDDVVMLNIRYNGDGELFLIGDLNDWKEPGIPLRRIGRNRYATELTLSPGGYEYKILLINTEGDRTWIEFSEETYTVPDGFGGENGMIFID